MVLISQNKLHLLNKLLPLLAFSILLLIPVGTQNAFAASFTNLGDLPGGDFRSRGLGISGDGDVAVGLSESALATPFQEAFRWTQGGGMIALGDLAGDDFNSQSRGVSGDGSVVVGLSVSASGLEAFR